MGGPEGGVVGSETGRIMQTLLLAMLVYLYPEFWKLLAEEKVEVT